VGFGSIPVLVIDLAKARQALQAREPSLPAAEATVDFLRRMQNGTSPAGPTEFKEPCAWWLSSCRITPPSFVRRPLAQAGFSSGHPDLRVTSRASP